MAKKKKGKKTSDNTIIHLVNISYSDIHKTNIYYPHIYFFYILKQAIKKEG